MQTVLAVHMVKSNCMEDSSEMKENYNCVTMESGFSCVIGGGGLMRQMLYVDSWDMPIIAVSFAIN